MKKKVFHAAAFVLLIIIAALLCGCGGKRTGAGGGGSALNDTPVSTAEPVAAEAEGEAEKISGNEALSAIRDYCYAVNPDLENIVKAGEYTVYWDISSVDEQEIVVLFRSYTGAQIRYYIDRNTGDTRVTEYVPGIMQEEQLSDERFSVRDYLSGE